MLLYIRETISVRIAEGKSTGKALDDREKIGGDDARMKYDEGYTDLANEIIIRAVKDYERTLHRMIRNPENKRAKEDIEKLESFFYSEWYEVLTDLDASYLLRKVKERIEKQEERTK